MRERIVVAGNGMAGVAFVEQLLKHGRSFDITIVGEETHVNYNRILLSSVLAGEKDFDDIVLNDIEWYQRHGIHTRLGVRVEEIDPERRRIRTTDEKWIDYDKLVIATGSSPLIPPIEGTTKAGVFVFRTLDDTRKLIELSGDGIRAAVIGGGLLGLEAARGLQTRGCKVTVIRRVELTCSASSNRWESRCCAGAIPRRSWEGSTRRGCASPTGRRSKRTWWSSRRASGRTWGSRGAPD